MLSLLLDLWILSFQKGAHYVVCQTEGRIDSVPPEKRVLNLYLNEPVHIKTTAVSR